MSLIPLQLRLKNLCVGGQVGPVAKPSQDGSPRSVRALLHSAAGQSGQSSGFYSEDLKSVMRLPAMS